MSRYLIIAVLLLTSAYAQAQSLERWLVPVHAAVSSSDSTRWTSSVWMLNTSPVPVRARYVQECAFECGEGGEIPTGSGWLNIAGNPNSTGGTVIYVEPSCDVALVNRYGTIDYPFMGHVPVVPERHFYTQSITFIDVPPQSIYRIHLRLYTLTGQTESFRVTIRRMTRGDQLPREVIVHTSAMTDEFSPGFAFVHDLPRSFEGPPDPYEITVEPITGAPFWAFVTATTSDNRLSAPIFAAQPCPQC